MNANRNGYHEENNWQVAHPLHQYLCRRSHCCSPSIPPHNSVRRFRVPSIESEPLPTYDADGIGRTGSAAPWCSGIFHFVSFARGQKEILFEAVLAGIEIVVAALQLQK